MAVMDAQGLCDETFYCGLGCAFAVLLQIVWSDTMSTKVIDEERLKGLLKSALVEALDEKRDMLRDLVAEAIEDIAMTRAIEAGSATKVVDSAEVYKILDKKN
jgi:hypothetical protein